jgi:hypothetical protein
MPRYEWKRIGDDPARYELFDNKLKNRLGAVVQAGRLWQWYRKTSIIVYGVPPAHGASETLVSAKNELTKGLAME